MRHESEGKRNVFVRGNVGSLKRDLINRYV